MAASSGTDARVLHLEQQVLRLEQKLVAERKRSDLLQHKLLLAQNAPAGHTPPPRALEAALPDLAHLSIDQSRLASEKADLENALEAEQEYIMHKLHKQLEAVKSEKECLRLEKQQLKSKVLELQASVQRLCQDKVNLEQTLELEEEAFLNSLCRQVASGMANYKAMDHVMQTHGIRIMPVTPQSPRAPLKRPSVVSQSVDASTPSTSARGSPVVRQAHTGRGARPRSARREGLPQSGGHSPGASLHATRVELEALSRSGVLARRALCSEDSMSSMGSIMSAMSRDPSVTRDSLAGSAAASAHPPASALSGSVLYSAGPQSDGTHGHK